MICYRVMKAILYRGIKMIRYFRILCVIYTALGKNIRDLLPDTALARTNRANPFKQLAEIVFTESRFPLFKPIVIKHEALDHLRNIHLPPCESYAPGMQKTRY